LWFVSQSQPYKLFCHDKSKGGNQKKQVEKKIFGFNFQKSDHTTFGGTNPIHHDKYRIVLPE